MSYRCFLYAVAFVSYVTFCHQLSAQETDEAFPLSHIVDAPLKDNDVLGAFSQLGLTLERFKYDLPVPHRMRFSLDQYRAGNFDTSSQGGSLIMGLGAHEINLFLIRKDEFLHFSAKSKNSSSSVGKCSLKGYSALAWNPFALAKIVVGERVPIGVLAADPNSVSGIGKDESVENILKYVDKFAFAVVVYVDVEVFDISEIR